MKYCGYCLNHGFRFYEWKTHKDNCPLRRCVCHKCREVGADEPEPVTSVAGSSNQNPETGQGQRQDLAIGNNETTPIDGQVVTNEREIFSDPFEEVKSLAHELAQSDISEKDLQTCVLYALLQSNEFSIEETKKQLCEARTAITESLVLPDFNVNRELNRKRSLSFTKQSNESSLMPCLASSSAASSASSSCPQSATSQTSSKRLFPFQNKAKKSIIRRPKTDSKSSSNSSVQTTAKESEKTPKVSNTKTSKSSTLTTVCTQTQTATESTVKSSSAPTPLTTVVNNKTYIFKPYTIPPNVLSTSISNATPTDTATNIVKKPIQSVRPLSTSTASPALTEKSTHIIIPLPISAVPSKSSSVNKSSSVSIPSAKFYHKFSSQKATKNLTTTSQLNETSSAQSIHNSIQTPLTSLPDIRSDIISTEVSVTDTNQNMFNLGPKIKTYSKIGPHKSKTTADSSPEQNSPKKQKLCAKVITTEDALTALSAIPNTKLIVKTSTINNSEQIQDRKNNGRSPQNGSSNSSSVTNEIPVQQPVIKDVKGPNTNYETSFSTQFKIFLDNLQNSAKSKTEEKQNNSSKTKDIIEITID